MEPKISSRETPQTETDGSLCFFDSLQDLRELRSQLRYAADYWETTFLNAEEKRELVAMFTLSDMRKNIFEKIMDYDAGSNKAVIENTRDYICSAVVTTVDHLGSMSAKLNSIISGTNAFSEAEFRVHCLEQRLLTCEQYTDKLALGSMRWSEKLPRLYSRYLSPLLTTEQASKEDVRKTKNIKHVLETEEDEPLLFYTCIHKPSNLSSVNDALKGETASARVLPVLDGLSALMKNPNSTFHFQVTQKIGRSRKSLHSGNILSLVRRTKRT